MVKAFSLDKLFRGRHYGDTESSSSSCTGECADYCRCSTITEARVESLYVNSISADIIPEQLRNTIIGYCVERILRICEVFNKDCWKVEIVGGYYGEEINGISLKDEIVSKVRGHIFKLIKMNDRRKMEYVLKLEYGYLLPILENKKWTIKQVKEIHIIAGQTEHYGRRLSQFVIDSYKDHEFPIAVCLECPATVVSYRLIDGYHRFVANIKHKRNTRDKVFVVVAMENK